MNEHVTLLRPNARSQGEQGISASLPSDLLEQVRGRMRVLALLMLFGSSIDPLLYFGGLLVVALGEGSRRLAEVPCAHAWTEERAGSWWRKHQPAQSPSLSG